LQIEEAFLQSYRVSMRLVQLNAPNEEDAACLMRELAGYEPKQLGSTIVVEIDEGSTSDLNALLSAVEKCVGANDIRSVRVELDGQTYTLSAQ
jgi:hypothetical protein